MAVNFNLLAQSGPQNLYSGFMQGQEAAAQNALMREKAAQEREMNALRRRQITGQIEGAEEDRAKARRAERVGMYRERILRAPTPEAAREVVKMQYADPEFGQMLSQMGTLEQALAEVPDDPTQFQAYQQREAMGMAEWLKSQMPKVVGNAVYLPGERRFVAAPSQRLVSVIGPDGQPTMVPADQAAGMTPLTAATAKMAGIGAAPAARTGGAGVPALPKAPPGYRYTPAGDLEAIPGGPAATKQAEATEKKEGGKAQATDILDTLEGAYEELNRRKAIPSQQRGAVANVLASLGATQAGQTASRALGTPEQTERDVIASARNQLFAAVKNATGLSASNLNSNVEFTTWMNSLTEPSKSIESNRKILENMRRFIASGGTYTAKKEDGGAPAAGARPAGVGADWTLMTDKNGNKAWVSPDRKSFKEVK